jgi:hypothetical protein
MRPKGRETLAANGAVETFLKRARRRYLTHLAIDQAAVATGLAMGGAILLLILGTQILNWYWPVLLFVSGLAVGIWRIKKLAPSAYVLAQKIDRRIGSYDALSTAYYFQTIPGANSPLVEFQRDRAERVAHETDIKLAVPMYVPRSAYVLAGVVAVVASLFAFRYGLMRTMDLSAPLANINFNPFSAETARKEASTKKSIVQERFDEQLKQLGLSLEDLDSPAGEKNQATDKSVSALATPDGQIPTSADEQGQSVDKGKQQEGDQEGTEGSESATSGTSNQPSDQEGGNSNSQQPGAQQGKPQSPPPGSKNASGENSSLAGKMRDAVANLLSKLKNSGKQGESQQSASAQNNAGAKQKQEAGQKGMQGQGKSQGEGQPNPDQQGDQDGEGGDQSQSAQSKAGDKNSDRAGQQDAKSGIGKQDGDKELRDAEQLAAMGKISELLGKRAAQVTGEMTVEVPSGKQQLRTAYTQKKAAHVDGGGEVNRDEVPLIYQPYVQRYFEEVRKSQGKSAKN